MKAPKQFFRNNTANRAGPCSGEAMLAAGVKRFVFSSTAAPTAIPSALRLQRTMPSIHQCLRRVEAAGRAHAPMVHQIHGLGYASLRYFNAAGASRPDQGKPTSRRRI